MMTFLLTTGAMETMPSKGNSNAGNGNSGNNGSNNGKPVRGKDKTRKFQIMRGTIEKTSKVRTAHYGSHSHDIRHNINSILDGLEQSDQYDIENFFQIVMLAEMYYYGTFRRALWLEEIFGWQSNDEFRSAIESLAATPLRTLSELVSSHRQSLNYDWDVSEGLRKDIDPNLVGRIISESQNNEILAIFVNAGLGDSLAFQHPDRMNVSKMCYEPNEAYRNHLHLQQLGTLKELPALRDFKNMMSVFDEAFFFVSSVQGTSILLTVSRYFKWSASTKPLHLIALITSSDVGEVANYFSGTEFSVAVEEIDSGYSIVRASTELA